MQKGDVVYTNGGSAGIVLDVTDAGTVVGLFRTVKTYKSDPETGSELGHSAPAEAPAETAPAS